MAWSIFTDGGGDSVAVSWAKQFLQMIGAPVTPGNTEFVYQWEKSEGGGGKYNPLNQGPVPGHPELTTTGSQYGGGAADFASWSAGLQGAADYLNMPNYTSVLAALRQNNPSGARQALWDSPWASSHYGYGTNWASVPLPGNANTITAMPVSSGSGQDVSSSSSNEAISYNANTCAIGIPLPSFSIGGIHTGTQGWKDLWHKFFGGGSKASPPSGICLLSKTQARAFLGGIMIGSGGIVTLLGAGALLAYGLSKSDTARQVVKYVPAGRMIVR